MFIVLPNFWSTKQCKNLTKLAEPKTMLIEDASYSIYRRHDFIDRKLAAQLKVLVQKHTGLDFQVNHKFHYTSYSAGGFIKEHLDGSSDYTFLVYLTPCTGYQGGHLRANLGASKLELTPDLSLIHIWRCRRRG